ncbi:UDP-glycosyltransferase 86A1 [Morus notabilis]|uniref:UDP-glycosyltransferase 86A1 n=1 Tax=Morus notabilis TaxID=981085 RepID=W9RX36_9ROSA|nr:UDP-glycosyltransferase 86A1 [Morus notabilis]
MLVVKSVFSFFGVKFIGLLKSVIKSNREDIIEYVPGVNAIEPKDLPSYLQETDVSNVMHRPTDKAFKDVKRTDFILCNTVEELELDPILALQEKQPFYAIGPVFPSGGPSPTIPNGSTPSLMSDIDEIALGLSLSKVNFIWVLRQAVSYEEPYVLPIGFEEEVKDRGLIVTRTNLIDITNRKLIVGGWKIGVNISDRSSLTRIDVLEKINRLIKGKSSDELKMETMKVRQTLNSALAGNGSSGQNLSVFNANVKAKISR